MRTHQRCEVSVLYREPKLLKFAVSVVIVLAALVSVLYREPKLLKSPKPFSGPKRFGVSVLYREPKLLKFTITYGVGRFC